MHGLIVGRVAEPLSKLDIRDRPPLLSRHPVRRWAEVEINDRVVITLACFARLPVTRVACPGHPLSLDVVCVAPARPDLEPVGLAEIPQLHLDAVGLGPPVHLVARFRLPVLERHFG